MSITDAVTKLEELIEGALPNTWKIWENRSKLPPKGTIYIAPRVLYGAVSPFSLGFYNQNGQFYTQELSLEIRIITPEGKGNKAAIGIVETLNELTRSNATITLNDNECIHLIQPSSVINLGQDDTNSFVLVHNTEYRYSRRSF